MSRLPSIKESVLIAASLAALACNDATGPGGPAKLAFTTQPGAATAALPIAPAIVVTVQDAAGHVVTTATSVITLALDTNSRGGVLGGVTSVAAVNGVATFTQLRIDKAGTGYKLNATSPNTTRATSATFSVVAGAPARLGFVNQPQTTIAHTMIPLVAVAVQDAGGNTVASAPRSVRIAIGSGAGSGSLSGTTTASTVNGIAVFSSLSINSTGVYTLTAYGSDISSAVSIAFNVTTGPPARLSFVTQPVSTTSGAPFTPAVSVAIVDAGGNTVTTATNNVSVSIGTNGDYALLSGTTTVAATAGIATFTNVSVDLAGSGYALAATSPNLISATSTPFVVTAGAATKLEFMAQPATTSPGGTISPAVVVAVEDAAGNVVPTAVSSISVAIGANAGNATLSGTTTVSAANGIATFANLSINNVGTGYTLTATSVNLSGGTSAPFTVRDAIVFATVSAGYFHTCGVAISGALYCWGTIVDDAQSTLPALVPGGITFASVGSGRTHSCGVSPTRVAFCWGDNFSGQLGNSTSLRTLIPIATAGGLTFATAIGGYSHSCGVTVAGAGFCWGDNSSGALGNASTASASVPVAVAGGLTFASISPGRDFTCGLTTLGIAYCWGDNSTNELGDGTTTRRTSPVAVAGQLVFSAIGAGGFHSCGLTTAGKAYCWGSNSFGQLGTGGNASSGGPVAVTGGLTFVTLTVGNRHNCGVTAGGAAYCWGDNSDGNLGDGTRISRSAPVAVSGGLTFATISAGRFHTCGVTTNGTAYCWGNSWLGNGTSGTSVVPVPVR